MRTWLHIFLWLAASAITSLGQHQPANFLIGDFTFERPSNWKWIETAAEEEKARLYIFDEAMKERGLVTFELTDSSSVQSFIEKWQYPYLRTSSPPTVHVETNKVNRYQVITVDILGSKLMNKAAVTNQGTHGVIIEFKEQRIAARVLGTQPLVAKLEPAFTKMIHDALKAVD